MANGDEVGKAVQRIVSDDPAGAALLQQKMHWMAAAFDAVQESPEFLEGEATARRDWLNATGREYPNSWDEIQRQAILAGVDINRFLDGGSGPPNETLGEFLPKICAGLERFERLRLLTAAATAGTVETTNGERVPGEAYRKLPKAFLRHVFGEISDKTLGSDLVKNGVRLHPEDSQPNARHSLRVEVESLINTKIYQEDDCASKLSEWKRSRKKL